MTAGGVAARLLLMAWGLGAARGRTALTFPSPSRSSRCRYSLSTLALHRGAPYANAKTNAPQRALGYNTERR
jgi:hypothetical protein